MEQHLDVTARGRSVRAHRPATADVSPSVHGQRAAANRRTIPASERETPAGRRRARGLRVALLLGHVLLCLLPARALAQPVLTEPEPSGGELFVQPFAGAFVPVGAQRELLGTAVLTGLQWSWRVTYGVAITSRLAWSPTRDLQISGDQRLDLFQYDIGGEARGESFFSGAGWDVTPFVGLGGGARTYVFRALPVRSKTNLAAYGALGVEFGYGSMGFRLEGRNTFSQLKPLVGPGTNTTRNDIAVSGGVFVRF